MFISQHHQAIICFLVDIDSPCPTNLTQLHYVTGDSIWSHRLSEQAISEILTSLCLGSINLLQ